MTLITPRASKVAFCTSNQFVSGEAGSLVGFRLKLSPRENLPVVIIRGQYRSAAPDSSPRRSDDWPGGRDPLHALRAFFSGRRGTSPGALNLIGPFPAARRCFSALLKYPQKSLSSLRVSLVRRVFALLHHARNKAWRGKQHVQRNQASGA